MSAADNVYLIYVTDGIAYPVGLTTEQRDMLTVYLATLGPLKAIANRPLGKAYTLAEEGTVNSNTERCDVCGCLLDQLNGEDFYDEPTGHVYCAKHWPQKEVQQR